MPEGYEVLGTDGFGLSESRPALRAHFEVDAAAIVKAALANLYRQGFIDKEKLNASGR
jgi:pyruvate dehydrogenase E1 component